MDKLERIACLYLTFLNCSSGISFTRLRKLMPTAYQGEIESVRRKFERDKKDLKELGLELKYLPHIDSYGSQGSSDFEHLYAPAEEIYSLPDVFLSEEDYRSLTVSLWGAMASPQREKKDLLLLHSAAAKLFYRHPAYAVEQEQSSAGIENWNKAFLKEARLSFSDWEPFLEMIYTALKSRKVLKVSYSNRQGKKTVRFLSGRGLISHKGRWCFIAYCHDSKSIRYFYVDRILSAEFCKEAYRGYPKADIRDYSLHPLNLNMHPLKKIKIQVRPEYEESFALFMSGAKKSLLSQENELFHLETSNQRGLFSWMVRNVDAVEKIGPPQTRLDFADYLEEIKALYQSFDKAEEKSAATV